MSEIPLSPIAEFLQRGYCRFVLHVGNKEITSSGSAPITAMRIFEGSSCRVRDIFVSLNPMTTMFKSMAAAMLKAAVDVFHIRPNVPVHLYAFLRFITGVGAIGCFMVCFVLAVEHVGFKVTNWYTTQL